MVFLLMGVVPSAFCSGDTVGSREECSGRTPMSEPPESVFHTRAWAGGPARFPILPVGAGPRNWIPDKCAHVDLGSQQPQWETHTRFWGPG